MAATSSAPVKEEDATESSAAAQAPTAPSAPASSSLDATQAPQDAGAPSSFSPAAAPSPAGSGGEPSQAPLASAAAAAAATTTTALPHPGAPRAVPAPSLACASGGASSASAPALTLPSAALIIPETAQPLPSCPPTERQITSLTSFAALLSSAETNGVSHPLTTGEGRGAQASLAEFLSEEEPSPSASAGVGGLFQPENYAATFPTLALRKTGDAASSTADAMSNLQDAAALNLASPLNVERQDIEKVPTTLLKNCSASFLKLVDSRLRSSIAALLRQIAKLGADDSSSGASEAGMVVKLLSHPSSGGPIQMTTVVTSFRVPPSENTQARTCRGADGTLRQDLTLPLIFEAVVDATALGKLVTVALQAPGTIMGSFQPREKGGKLSHIEVTFDTLALLKSMMDQARVVVKKAVARAATVASAASKAAKAKEEALKRALEEQRLQREEERQRREREERRRRQQQQILLAKQQAQAQQAQDQAQLWGHVSAPAGSLGADLSVTSFGSLAKALARHTSSEIFEIAKGGATLRENSQDNHNQETHVAQQNQNKRENPLAAQLDAFPQHLRETMAQLAKENPPPQPQQAVDNPFLSQQPQAANDWLDEQQGHQDDGETDGHCQPLTLSSLYEREDRDKREAEERAAKLKALAAQSSNNASGGGAGAGAVSGGKKIELFSWLKGDSMLLSEEEDELALHAAAAAATQQQQRAQAAQQAQAQHTMERTVAINAAQHQQLQQQQQATHLHLQLQQQQAAQQLKQTGMTPSLYEMQQLLQAHQLQNEMAWQQGQIKREELNPAHLQAIQNAQLMLDGTANAQRQGQVSLSLGQEPSSSISNVPYLNLAAGLQDASAGTNGGGAANGDILGVPATFAAGRLPHTLSALSTSDMMLTGAAGAGAAGGSNSLNLASAGSSTLSLAQQEEGRRTSLPSCLMLGRSNASFGTLLKSVASVTSTANLAASIGGSASNGEGGGGRKRVSFSSGMFGGSGMSGGGGGSAGCGRNESFDSSTSGSSNKKMKKQVSFGLQHNGGFGAI